MPASHSGYCTGLLTKGIKIPFRIPFQKEKKGKQPGPSGHPGSIPGAGVIF